jgi:hypothetical protein
LSSAEERVTSQGLLLAPLPFAGNTIVVTIHLDARAVLKKDGGLFARRHLGTVRSTVAFEPRMNWCWGRGSLPAVPRNRLTLDLGSGSCNVRSLIFRVPVPNERTDNEEENEPLHGVVGGYC